jgi:glycosyltransferase involved in cell wall biosynthesis
VRWLPIPAPQLRDATADETGAVRHRFGTPGGPIVGHFGTFSPLVTPLLESALDVVLQSTAAAVLLIGRGGDRFRESFLATRPHAASRVHATGLLEPDAVCRYLQACDVMIQPYPDGISARRTSALALMAHGVPVVTNTGWLTETFWRETGAVALIAEPDGRRVGLAAVETLHDPPRRQRLAAAALAMYDSMFHVRHAIEAVEAGS